MHDIQDTQLRDGLHKHSRDDGKVFCNVVGDGEGGQAAAGNQELFANFDNLQNLGGIGIQIHHVRSLFCGSGAAVHGKPHIRLSQCRSIICAVAGHGHDLAFCLFFLDDIDFVLWLALGDKAVHTGFFGNGRRCQRIIASTHDGLDADGTQTFKPFHHTRLYRILQIDDAKNAAVLANRQRRAAQTGNFVHLFVKIFGDLTAQALHILFNGVSGALPDFKPIWQIHTAHPGLGRKLDKSGAFGFRTVVAQTTCQLQSGFSFRRLIVQAG